MLTLATCVPAIGLPMTYPSRGPWFGGRDRDGVAEVGEAAEAPPDPDLLGAAVKVLRAELPAGGPALEHAAGGGQERGCHRADRLFGAPPAAEAVVLRLERARPLTARRPGALDEGGSSARVPRRRAGAAGRPGPRWDGRACE